MTAAKVKITNFQGSGRVFERTPLGLAPLLRGLAIQAARTAIKAASISSITDSSGGVAFGFDIPLAGVADLAPSGVFNATSSNGVGYSALNTSLGKFRNASAVWVGALNVVLAKLGLPALTYGEGTVATAYTVPAQDTSNTGQTGTSAVNYGSYLASMTIAISNQHIIAAALNSALVALGADPVPLTGMGEYAVGNALTLIPAVTADATGADSVALADGSALMAALAANWATMAKYWNQVLPFGSLTSLTDSTGGTSSAPALNAVIVTPLVGYQDVSTSSLGYAAFNAQLALYQNAFSSIQAKINQIAEVIGAPQTEDLSGGTVSNTLAAESVSLTAATSTASATLVSVEEALAQVEDNISTLAAQINKLLKGLNIAHLVDASGGVAQAALSPITPTVGADNTTSAIGVQNTAADTVVTAIRNNISTLAAVVNTLLSTSPLNGGLLVVAA